MGPEYGALGQFAASCGVTDARAVLAANYICTSCGIDPVSAGAAIACAMGLARMGRLPVSENGLVLSSGDPASLLGCLESMASGKGLGKLLAQGARRLADHAGAPETFMGVKGLELPPYEPRAVQGLGLHFATSNFGAYDLNGLTVIDEVLGVHCPANPLEVAGKAEQVKMYQDAIAAVDSMGVCVLPLMAVWLKDLAPVFKSATGMDINAEGLMKAGERIWNLERLFNLREGINGATDTLPERFTREPIPAGPAAGKVCELSRMLPEYYRLRGWNEKGAPMPEKLSELGLA
jgi:aldehyde:ferredoxin oxidoreductase